MNSPTRVVLLAIVVAVSLGACAADGYEEEVAIEARWQCDVQHRTYADLALLDADLEQRLSSAGITGGRYAEFKSALEKSAKLRSEVPARAAARDLSERARVLEVDEPDRP